MICTASGALSNVVLNLWLIPLLGIMGAAWATVASQAIAAWLLGYFLQEIKISSKMIAKAIFSSILIYPCYKSVKNILKEANE
jgi:Na+-driven multidrug efflux pump